MALLCDEDCESWKADAFRWQEAAGLTTPYVDEGIDAAWVKMGSGSD